MQQVKTTNMKKTATLIMLDKPILVNDEEIKEGHFGVVYSIGINGVGSGWSQFKHDGSNKSKLLSITKDSYKIIAGHEGTKRLTFNLSEEDAKRIGYINIEKLANKTYSEFPTDKQSIYNKDINAPRKRKAFIKGANTYASLTLKKYTEEDVIEFSEWRLGKGHYRDNKMFVFYETKPFSIITTKELFEIFLKQRQPKQYKVEYTETETEIIVTKIL